LIRLPPLGGRKGEEKRSRSRVYEATTACSPFRFWGGGEGHRERCSARVRASPIKTVRNVHTWRARFPFPGSMGNYNPSLVLLPSPCLATYAVDEQLALFPFHRLASRARKHCDTYLMLEMCVSLDTHTRAHIDLLCSLPRGGSPRLVLLTMRYRLPMLRLLLSNRAAYAGNSDTLA